MPTDGTALADFATRYANARAEMDALLARREHLSSEIAISYVAQLTGEKGPSRRTIEQTLAKVDAEIEAREPALRQAEQVRHRMAAADAERELATLTAERVPLRAEFWTVANRLRELLVMAVAQSGRLEQLAHLDEDARSGQTRAFGVIGSGESAVPVLPYAAIPDLARLLSILDSDLAIARRDESP